MAKAVLVTGGNMGDVKDTLRHAQQEINRQIGVILRCSHAYESKAWGFTSSENFFNQAILVDTDLTPAELLDKVLSIEKQLGRDRHAEAVTKAQTGESYSSRVVDIDIIFYDDEVVDMPDLKIPHPLLQNRDFVLRPLHEIIPDKIHPVLKRSVRELYDEMESATKKL